MVHAVGLAVALLVYGCLGSPAPPGIGPAEAVIAFGLFCAVGVARPLGVGSGLMLIAPAARPHEITGTAAFLYLLWVPSLRAALMGNDPEDVLRDVIPLIYLFLPILLVPAVKAGRDELPWGMAAVGLLFASRWWWSGVNPWSIGHFMLEEGDLYLLNSPAVLFAAVWLPLEGAAALTRKPGAGSIARAAALVAGGAIAAAALAGVVHRAAIMMALASVCCHVLYQTRRMPMALVIVAVLVAGVAAVIPDLVLGTVQRIATKTETYGLNERLAETAVVFRQVGASFASVAFGEGWGALVRNPAVGELWVSYTHGLATYMLLKTGIIGALATLAYLLSLWPSMVRLISREPSLAFALAPALGLGLFAHTSFKYLCFGLLLAVVTRGGANATPPPTGRSDAK
ncbi:membrane protein [Skermanella stibiiresistens SB22]|uniref:Membrane protein n=1 Tax=Skermanella stibiiresistens SB22 TaxID=1385369 RepID=W9H4Z6_9PROT|nr:hypothetical protein [Skermanella stibiiresistens]EWY38838.1 membrane protein [Skermanella stibiiresistens SB22]